MGEKRRDILVGIPVPIAVGKAHGFRVPAAGLPGPWPGHIAPWRPKGAGKAGRRRYP